MSGFLNTSSLRTAKSNANYLFEGDFRRRPDQNLSGASRMVNRGQLLQEAALQRQDREDRRRRIDSSVKIQAVWRGYKCRKNLGQPARLDFDRVLYSGERSSMIDDINSVDLIIKTFLLNYNSKKDHDRLLVVNNLFMDKQNQIILSKQHNPGIWNYRILKLLKINLSCLSRGYSKDGSDLKHLIFIERFTRDTVMNTKEQNSAWKSLMQLKLFSILRNIIDQQDDRESIDDNFKSIENIHTIILELIRRSINIDDISNHISIGCFFTIFLAGPLTSILEDFYLPKLLEVKPKGLMPGVLLDSFDQLMNNTVQKLPKLTKQSQILDKETMILFTQATWLSYTFVIIVDSQVNQLTETDKCKYLNILSVLITPIEQLFHFNNAHRILDHDSKNDEDDYDSNMVDSNKVLDPEKALVYQDYSKKITHVIHKLVKLINCQTHVDNLRSILFNSESNSKVHTAIIKICNFTLAHEELAIFNCPLLYTIAFNWDFLRKLWKSITSTSSGSLFGHNTPVYSQITKGDASISSESWDLILPQLKLFCSIYSYLLPTLDDEEFYTSHETVIVRDQSTSEGNRLKHRPGISTPGTYFVDRELISISAILRDLCVGMIEIIYHENKYINHSDPFDKTSLIKINIRHCFKAIVRLVCQIHARDSRKQFCPTGHWICPSAMVPTNKAIELQAITSQYGRLLDRIDNFSYPQNKQPTSNIPRDIKGTLILQEIPFVIPFEQRVQMFHQLINQEKRLNTSDGYYFGIQGHAIALQVRRNYIYEDAFRKLSHIGPNNPNMKSPLKVSLINAVGADEVGIDGGGVTKEFLSELLKAGFDPMRGFFKSTNDHQLYPNPSAKVLFSNLEDGYIIHYEFLGKMLGKALLEKVMVELPFASFFLAKILARSNQSDVDWHNLASLDPIVYKNLVYLKNYTGDVADLNLDFTITNNELDEKETVELKPGGSKVPVTKSNRVEYVHLVADYRLNKQIRAQCAAFKKGLSELIDLDWLRMFDPREFQILISGAPVSIDIADWRRHTVYGNGYTDESEPVVIFWRIVNSLDEAHKRKLLKFATSCSNPPLLGFRDLYPQFTIAPSEETRLPTASTCMNLLKLPQCNDDTTMKSKILYAIDSNSGFDLS